MGLGVGGAAGWASGKDLAVNAMSIGLAVGVIVF